MAQRIEKLDGKLDNQEEISKLITNEVIRNGSFINMALPVQITILYREAPMITFESEIAREH